MNNIGVMYHKGNGVAKDYKQSYNWYLKAANAHYGMAAQNLGDYFKNGFGVEKNMKEAVKWYNVAAQNWENKSAVKIVRLTESRAYYSETQGKTLP